MVSKSRFDWSSSITKLSTKHSLNKWNVPAGATLSAKKVTTEDKILIKHYVLCRRAVLSKQLTDVYSSYYSRIFKKTLIKQKRCFKSVPRMTSENGLQLVFFFPNTVLAKLMSAVSQHGKWTVQNNINDLNPFHATGLLLHPLKISQNRMFSDVFKGCR